MECYKNGAISLIFIIDFTPLFYFTTDKIRLSIGNI